MSAWTSIADIRAQLLKRWQKGQFLAEAMEATDLFPLRIGFKHPSANQLGEDFASARLWVPQFQQAEKNNDFTVEWRVILHRQLGKNELPVACMFETLEQAVAFIKKTRELRRFIELSGPLLSKFIDLKNGLLKSPHEVLDHGDAWLKLISVLEWMVANPRPGIYLRQISLPDIDSKFIEQHKKLLSAWLDILLEPNAIYREYTGVSGFEQRYGFIAKPNLVRFRILDEHLFIHGLSDLSVTTDEFCKLDLAVDSVFVTENDINGLAFPQFKRAIVIFGRGYGFDYLAQAHWLQHKDIRYWGDIDTHGFAILSQFRKYFPQTQSLLMDRGTLLSHYAHWVTENRQTLVDLPNLTIEEAALFDDLRYNRMGKAIRLEQEYVSYHTLLRRLKCPG